MDDLERQLLIKGLDVTSAEVNMGSWAPATKKQYNSYLEKWTIFCVENRVNPRKPSIIEIMRYLTWLSVSKGMSYSAINTARSALSAYVQPFGIFTAGSHPEIRRHVKGINRKNPTPARIMITWDVNTVFIMLKKWAPLSSLSLTKLTFKCVMLLALVLAQRAQTLAYMKLSGLTWLDEKVLIGMEELLKHNRQGQPLEIFQVSRFNKDKRLCPVRTLKEYLKATKKRRGGSNHVWISLSKPYHGVGTETISRWLRRTLALAGVNDTVYKGHSTRSASTSKAKQLAVPLETILKRARWTNATTFGKYYDKAIEPEHEFQNALLSDAL